MRYNCVAMRTARLKKRPGFACESASAALLISVLVLCLLAGVMGGIATRAATGQRKPQGEARSEGEPLPRTEPEPVQPRPATMPAEPAPAPAPPAAFDAGRAIAHVAYLSQTIGAREQGTPGEAAAARYIQDQLASCGFTVSTQSLRIPVTGRTTENVIATAPGTQRPGSRIIIGAHIDSKGGPGANDNATGIGVLLELARILKNNMRQVPVVEFVFFGGEEVAAGGSSDQHHWGSRHFVNTLPPAEKAATRGMISVDMVGAGSNFFANNMGLAPQTMRDFLVGLGSGRGLVYRKDPGWSDHEPFEKAGVPSIWLEYTGGNPYHEPADNYGSVDSSHVQTTGALLQEFFESYLTPERFDLL